MPSSMYGCDGALAGGTTARDAGLTRVRHVGASSSSASPRTSLPAHALPPPPPKIIISLPDFFSAPPL